MKRAPILLALAFAGAAHAQDLDTNGDGLATREEVEAATLARFSRADADGDARLSASELAGAATNAAELLYILDADQDGALNGEEWASYAAGAAALAIAVCDADKDGALGLAEISCSRR